MLLFFSVNKEDQDGISLHKACLVHSHLTTPLTILTMFSVLHLFLGSLSSICMTSVPHSLEHISLQHSLGITVLSVRNWPQRRCTQVHVGTLGQSWILSQVFWILCLYPPLKHFFSCWHSPFLEKFHCGKQNGTGSSAFMHWWVYTTASGITSLYPTWWILPQILEVMQKTRLDWHSISFTFAFCHVRRTALSFIS